MADTYEIHITWDTLETPEQKAAKRQKVEDAILAAQRGTETVGVKLVLGRAEADGVFGFEVFPAWLQALLRAHSFQRDVINIMYLRKCDSLDNAQEALKAFWAAYASLIKGQIPDGKIGGCPVTADDAKAAYPHLRAEILLPYTEALREA